MIVSGKAVGDRVLRKVSWPLGLLLEVFAIVLALCGVLGFLAQPEAGWDPDQTMAGFKDILRAAGITAAAGGVFLLGGLGVSRSLGRREALVVVSVIWLAMGFFGALPFVIGAEMSWPDAIFEAFSGVTTTGATVLPEIAQRLSAPLHMWRMATHWLGGLGIVVLFVALLPSLGIGGKLLFQSEIAGPQSGGLSPRVRDSAKTLLWIYLGFTLAEVLALRLVGMPWFDALTHAMSTMGTGGFSTKNNSISDYNSAAVEAVLLVFMLIAGTNFGLFWRARSEGWRVFWRSREFRLYLGLFGVVTVLIAVELWMHMGRDVDTSLRQGAFQVASVMTTTGFGTDDFAQWTTLSQILLVMLYFCGGMAGSTAGGMKLIRIMIMIRVVLNEIRLSWRPNLVAPVRIGAHAVSSDIVRATLAYALIFLGTVAVGALCVAVLNPVDLTTAVMASLACVSNVGPGLAAVGPTEHFGFFSDATKLILSICMLLGRLEFFSLLALLMPSFWRR